MKALESLVHMYLLFWFFFHDGDQPTDSILASATIQKKKVSDDLSDATLRVQETNTIFWEDTV